MTHRSARALYCSRSEQALHWLSLAALGAEAVADFGDDLDQQIDFGGRVVEVEAGPGAGGDSEAVVEGPGAMVAGADGDALLVE